MQYFKILKEILEYIIFFRIITIKCKIERKNNNRFSEKHKKCLQIFDKNVIFESVS